MTAVKKRNLDRILLGVLLSFVFIGCNEDKPAVLKYDVFDHGGLKREFIYYEPIDLPKNSPLVVVLHGFTSSAEKIMNYSKMNALARQNNFAVVYPQGITDNEGNTFWNVGYDFHSEIKIDDVDYIVKLVQHLQNKYSLSDNNSFLTGMSNGGEMCYLLVCRHPEIFKATAPVAGMMLQGFFDKCNLNKPIPIFAIFGTADEVTNFNGDMSNKDGWGAYPSIPFTIDYWAKAINYSSSEVDTLPDINMEDNSYIVRERYLNKQNASEVLFYKVINGGHDWPGAGGNMDIDLSGEIWSFFEKYKQ